MIYYICYGYTVSLRTISNSIVTKTSRFFVLGEKIPRLGIILVDIVRKYRLFSIYTPFSGGIYLMLAPHLTRYIKYLSKLVTTSFKAIHQQLTKIISLLVFRLCFNSNMERAQTTKKNDAVTLRQFN